MKKFLVLLIAVVMLASFGACGGGGEDVDPIVGTWDSMYGPITFNADGTMTVTLMGAETDATYVVDGTAITFTYPELEEKYEFVLDGDTLTLDKYFNDAPMGAPIEYTRK